MRRLRTTLIFSMLLALGIGSTRAAESSTFERMLTHYESIRQALLNDETEGVADHARHIEHLAHALEQDFSEETAGIRGDRADDLRALLPTLREAAGKLAESANITDARTSFGELSRAMVRYRQMTADPLPAVAFCSMARAVWLQPQGEIGNPYYGQSMARCGEFVSE